MKWKQSAVNFQNAQHAQVFLKGGYAGARIRVVVFVARDERVLDATPSLRNLRFAGSLGITFSRNPEAPRIFTRLRNSGLPPADNVR